MHTELLIDGVFYGGPCDSSIGKTQHYAPFDGKLVGTAAEAGWAEVSAALNAAESAFQTWRKSPLLQRKELLLKISANVRNRSEELAQLLVIEVGKPIQLARAEVERLAITFELASDLLNDPTTRSINLGNDKRRDDFEVFAARNPIGVVLAIVPYNWPLNLAAHKIAPAIASGNTVVVKTPSIGTLTLLTLARLIHECGCPDGVVNVINCPSILAQKAAEDSRTTMLSFTGSPKIGWMLKGLVPRKRVALELGSDSTAIVAADADISICSKQLAISSFAYAGQICISTQHILVHQDIYEEFRNQFLEETSKIKSGNPLDEDVLCGPVINNDSLERIKKWVDEAEELGCVIHGGSQISNVLEPTIVENVTRNMTLGKEEVFGPVATLQSYKSDQEALKWVNQSQFGIHMALFTNDESRIQYFFDSAEVGGIIINDSPSVRFDAMPYGGTKNSGFGREGVFNSYIEMTEEKTFVRRKNSIR